jgi:hypothetical protein
MFVVHLAIVQGYPKLTLLATNLPSLPYVLVNDHQGDHAMEVPKSIQG